MAIAVPAITTAAAAATHIACANAVAADTTAASTITNAMFVFIQFRLESLVQAIAFIAQGPDLTSQVLIFTAQSLDVSLA